MRRLPILIVLTALLMGPVDGLAGGYDTPILYSARHIGMGGTAIGFVSDPSALFHNPAGLSHTKFIAVTADFSPILGLITSSPSFDNQNTESDLTFAPFFLAAAGFRITDWMTLGIGAYPVASAGAEYIYTSDKGTETEDRTKIAFIEIAPGISFDLPWNLSLGASYRVTVLSFQRYQNGVDSTKDGMFDMDMKGYSFAGFKVGLQWQPFEWLQAGLVYRHKTTTTVEADSAIAVLPLSDASMEFVLPSSFGVGIRGDMDPIGVPLGIAVDVTYTLQSQNDSAAIEGTVVATGTSGGIPNYYMWNDNLTLRTGLEYAFLKDYKARLGYVFDDKVGNEYYPSAFGTPPTPTHSFTAGLGGRWGMFEANVAYAYRMGSVHVPTKEEREGVDGLELCLACSKGGDYELGMNGFYVDFSLYFD